MPNPWVNLPPLPSSSYVLPVDVSYVDCFNKSAAPSHQIVTDQIPEPWLGSAQDACLFVLQLNPRYLLTDAPAAKKHPVIGKLNEPHFGITDRDKWWLSCFKKLALDIGCSLHPDECLKLQLNAGYMHLATRVCSVEYFPYGSNEYSHSLLRLPSQDYSFELVRDALSRGVYIAVMKGYKEWLGAVPELCGYGKLGLLKGYRGAKYISPASCGDSFYNSLLATLHTCNSTSHEPQAPRSYPQWQL